MTNLNALTGEILEPGQADPKPKKLTRDQARASIFSPVKLERITVYFRGIEIEVRQPTVGDMIQLAKARNTEEQRSAIIDVLFRYSYMPGTEELVFEEGDEESIKGLPWDKSFTDVQEAFGKLTGVEFRKREGGTEEE